MLYYTLPATQDSAYNILLIALAPLTSEGTSLQNRLSMARVVEGFHSFFTLRLSTNGINHTRLYLPSRSWSSFADPGGMEGWVGLCTTTESKQSAQDCYLMAVIVVNCSNHHASLGSGEWVLSEFLQLQESLCSLYRTGQLRYLAGCRKKPPMKGMSPVR